MALNKCTSIMWCDGRPNERRPDKHYTKCNGVAGHDTSHVGECPAFGWVRYWTDGDEDTDTAPPSKSKWAVWANLDTGSGTQWQMLGPFDTNEQAEEVLAVVREMRDTDYAGTVYELTPASILEATKTIRTLEIG